MKKQLRGQRGVSLSGLLVTCLVLGLIALIIMRLFPLYNEAWRVYSAMESVAQDPEIGNKSPAEVRKLLMRKFEISEVRRFNDRTIKDHAIIRKIKDSKDRSLQMKYEGRGPFVHDLELVLNFDRSIVLPARSTPQ